MLKMRKLLAVLLVLALVVPFAVACKEQTDDPVVDNPVDEPDAPVVEATEEPEEEENDLPKEPTTDTPLVVAYSPFSEKFSPFYADTGYDQDVVGMTQISLMTTDRMGGIIFNAIEGETVSYNGTDYLYTGAADLSVKYDEATDTTTYTAKIRDDLVFSDGVPVTADDIIFTYYTLLDPAYVGSSSLNSLDIVGLENYLTQTSDEVNAKYTAMADAIFAAGNAGYVANEEYSEELYNAYWETLKQAWIDDCQAIVDYVAVNYGSDDYVQTYFNPALTWADVNANEGLKVAYGMAMWGFGAYNADGTFSDFNGKIYDMVATFPTVEDYYDCTYAKYAGDPVAYWGVEAADGTDVVGAAKAEFIREYGSKDEAMGGEGVKGISGITKLDDYTVQVVLKGFAANAVYQILGQQITPLHYYGDAEQYDYENGNYGFPFGDLTLQKAKTEVPMGAGAYKFVSYQDKVVTFEANPYYYKGCPKIKTIQFKEGSTSEVATGISTGDVDAGELDGSRTRFEEVASYNSNGEITGDVITTSKVDNLGYGYIGMNADTVNVGGAEKAASAESKALRKALATILSVYRDISVDSYYGEAASVIQYPISNTSWAAPQASDEGYQTAFSVDAAGNALYTAEMTEEEKYAAAAAGALTWFEAAGYTVEGGKVVAAPEGGKTEFTVIIPAEGKGDHPSYMIMTMAQQAFEAIGITLIINDPADSNVLWDALDAGQQELWCAAWGSTIDPDMYQVYHSNNIVGKPGSTESNHYHIADADLDAKIMAGRTSDDQAYRKSVYKECLDIIIDWAVEIPVYQRQNCIVFSTERINVDTITPDITTFWGWMSNIELLDMN